VKLRPEDWAAAVALVVADPFISWTMFYFMAIIFFASLVYLLYDEGGFKRLIDLVGDEVKGAIQWQYKCSALSVGRPREWPRAIRYAGAVRIWTRPRDHAE
jgi:hypothetical protein